MSTHLDPKQYSMATQTTSAHLDEEEEYYEEAIGNSSQFIFFTAAPSWLVSLVVHFILLLVLGMWTLSAPDEDEVNMLEVEPVATKIEEVEELEEIVVEQEQPTETDVVTPNDTFVSDMVFETPVEVTEPVTLANDIEAAAVQVTLSDFGPTTAPRNDLMATIGAMSGHGVEGRGMKVRAQMVRSNGGNEASEAAVAAALRWLAEHQYPDGGWSFDHTLGRCQGRCSHPGTADGARNAATAMALLPFLGAGNTHLEGEYKETVRGGLQYLVTHIKNDHGTGSFHEPGGSMYSHGLASITLCEAYAMTHDKGLLIPAQASLNFIAYAQDPVGGGWRYSPRQEGDTSAVGWQIMALKSGHMGYLQINPNTIRGAMKFLDQVQSESGAYYGYTGPGKGQSTTAVGLLCRMYLGWKKDEPALARGVEYLSKIGPSKNNLYYNYYATQVVKQYGGEDWDKWNVKMRDFLVAEQDKNGHQKGSWDMDGGHGDRGGRLYSTSMATMILEVYYRHMPIYGAAATEDEFPL
ncbi:prenyltransferase/squalene oxidase repeat-containing protein [Lignipirellula cremea]|uniref:Pectic acid lyase n=1 Tax=Lignipirellula cremea TaxID=2528010 RepID=A0A518E1B2_9BACT|nr:prenyltransferase/squalene oxidase repeat-containing protein [Lignipirellula cremea]QDU97862.1 Pectic acid lyase [Lignipirellula cremea]